MSNNLYKGNFSGSDLLDLFREYKFDIDDLISETNVSIPEGSTFYDKQIEEVFGDPLSELHKEW